MEAHSIADALAGLDHRLLTACDVEERRAKRLAGGGNAGWEGVRDLVRPHLGDLVPEPTGPFEDLVDSGPLGDLGRALGLSAVELEIVLVVLAPHVEPRYQSVYAVLQDDLNQPLATERLLRAVLGVGGFTPDLVAATLSDGGALCRSGVVSSPAGPFPPLARPFDLAADVVAALLGRSRPPVAGVTQQRWSVGSGAATEPAPFLVVFGPGDREGTARARASSATELLLVELPASLDAARQVARSAWRIGATTGALPVLDGRPLRADDGAALGAELEALVRDVGGRAWMLAVDALPLAVPQVPVLATGWSERRAAWIEAAGRVGIAIDRDGAGRLATRHRLTGVEIDRVVAAAPAARPVTPPVTWSPGEAEAALDAVASSLGFVHVERSSLTIPARSFDDLVLRDTTRQALERLIYYVRHRDRVADALALGARHRVEKGPLVLFSGRSGTGKTLAAEALAGSLGRPLHTVDLARLVSKYVGETEQHIDEVLTQAERGSVALFFDEADAIFANRVERASSSSEQFANMLVGYLLQRIEVHDGLVILATNLRQAIDEAFLRRFQFRIEFPLPDADERARIWDLLLPGPADRAPDLDLAAVGRDHRLAGGDIRNAALKAVFLAEERGDRVGREDLDRAVALEMLELGRLSRRPAGAEVDDGHVEADRGTLLRSCLEALRDRIDDHLRSRFLKEIHVVHGSPTEDRLAGRRPAVSLDLFRIAAGRPPVGLRAGFIVSAWSSLAEEESELLGVVNEALSGHGPSLIAGREATIRLQESHDFDLLHRYWTSHEHPVRPSLVVDVDLPVSGA
ncbi:MAG: AAA family ATPase [Acidimicrobiales bacterium]